MGFSDDFQVFFGNIFGLFMGVKVREQVKVGCVRWEREGEGSNKAGMPQNFVHTAQGSDEKGSSRLQPSAVAAGPHPDPLAFLKPHGLPPSAYGTRSHDT